MTEKEKLKVVFDSLDEQQKAHVEALTTQISTLQAEVKDLIIAYGKANLKAKREIKQKENVVDLPTINRNVSVESESSTLKENEATEVKGNETAETSDSVATLSAKIFQEYGNTFPHEKHQFDYEQVITLDDGTRIRPWEQELFENGEDFDDELLEEHSIVDINL